MDPPAHPPVRRRRPRPQGPARTPWPRRSAGLGRASLLVACLAGASSVAEAADRAAYTALSRRLERSYLHIEEFDVLRAFREAAEAAETAVPWLLVDTRGAPGSLEVVLSHGDTGPFATVRLAPPSLLPGTAAAGDEAIHADLDALVDALSRLDDAIHAEATRRGAPIEPPTDLAVELMRGVSRALDRHSVVLAGERLDRFNERIGGRLVGIGCRVEVDEGGLVVEEVFADGPAARGGLRPGDRVLRIDGISTFGMDLDDAVDRIRGARGTPVRLRVRSPGDDVERTLQLLRDEVRIPNVTWRRTDAGVGWIGIDHFSQQTARLMERALAELSEEPAVSGVVLDLRGNSGGSMLQAAKTVDLFVDEGVILQTGGRGFQRVPGLVREVRAWPPGEGSAVPALASEVPVVVLQDHGSASASEIVAGALSLLGRAVIVGEASHGKGTVQQPFVLRPANDERGEVKIKLTIAEYRLAGDTPVEEGVGIAPDVAASLVTLGEEGARIPLEVTEGRAIGLVQEQSGWRSGEAPPDRGDLLLHLAERLIARTQGPERVDLLQSARELLPALQREELARLDDALAARGVDWSADDLCRGPCPPPEVSVSVRSIQPLRAGRRGRLEVRVVNRGASPLYRVLVRLSLPGSRLPWRDMTVPVGVIPPGEEARSVVEVDLPMVSASREDLVAVTLAADRRTPVAVDPVVLRVEGDPDPRVGVAVTGLDLDGAAAPGEAGARVLRTRVRVDNLSARPIEELRVRFHHPDDPALEPLEREQIITALDPGESAEVSLSLAWTGSQAPPREEPIDLELQVAAERYGQLLDVEVPTRFDGSTVQFRPPWVVGDVPAVAPPGILPLWLVAEDDRAIEHVAVWWGGDKLAWRSADGPQLSLEVDPELSFGTQRLVVDATDDDGVTRRRQWAIRVASEADGAAGPED